MKRAPLKTHLLPLPRLDAEPDLQIVVDQLLEDHPVASFLRRGDSGLTEPIWVGPATLGADGCHVLAAVEPWDEIVAVGDGRTPVEWRFSDPELDIEVSFFGTARLVRRPAPAGADRFGEPPTLDGGLMLSTAIDSFRLSVPSHGIEISRTCRALRNRLRRRSMLNPPRSADFARSGRRRAA